jgi:hypothetical protein
MVSLTLMVDTTPGVMDFSRRPVLEMAAALLDELSLDDRIRFVTYDGWWGLNDTGFHTLREVYPDIGRFCKMNSYEFGGECPPVESIPTAVEAIQFWIRNLIGRGSGDADIVEPFAEALDEIDDFARNAVVVVSDFRVDERQVPAHERGRPTVSSVVGDDFQMPMLDFTLAIPGLEHHARENPLSVFFVGTDKRVPLERIGAGDVHYLGPRNGPEVARKIVERIPPFHVAVLDARAICGRVRGCAKVDLVHERGYEIRAQRCPPIETPKKFGKRILKIKDADARAEYVRTARLYEDSPAAPYFAEGIRRALGRERTEHVRKAMEEVLEALEGTGGEAPEGLEEALEERGETAEEPEAAPPADPAPEQPRGESE